MKKRIALLMLFLLFLAGCMNPTSVKVVQDMYKQALLDDEERMRQYFSEDFLNDYSIDELTKETANHIRDAGGVSALNAVELNRKQLTPEIVDELDDTYGDGWRFIVNEAENDSIMTWVVMKTPTKYIIVGGEKMVAEKYREDVKK